MPVVEEEPKVDWTPTRKVTAGAAGGALATLVVSLLPSFGVQIPPAPGTEAAIGVLGTLAFAYIFKEQA